MFLTVGDVLSGDQLSEVERLLGGLGWNDGAKTAGATARAVKRNQQADLNTDQGRRLTRVIQHALKDNQVINSAAQPSIFSNLLLSRTLAGGGYGAHIDNALMSSPDGKMRSDLSFTLFLSDPDTYEGGELSIETSAGTQSLKLKAGDLVLYPSSLIHQVETVISGERFVAAGWIESHIRDGAYRDILFDLSRVRLALRSAGISDAERLLLDKVYSNLLRIWSGL